VLPVVAGVHSLLAVSEGCWRIWMKRPLPLEYTTPAASGPLESSGGNCEREDEIMCFLPVDDSMCASTSTVESSGKKLRYLTVISAVTDLSPDHQHRLPIAMSSMAADAPPCT